MYFVVAFSSIALQSSREIFLAKPLRVPTEHALTVYPDFGMALGAVRRVSRPVPALLPGCRKELLLSGISVYMDNHALWILLKR